MILLYEPWFKAPLDSERIPNIIRTNVQYRKNTVIQWYM